MLIKVAGLFGICMLDCSVFCFSSAGAVLKSASAGVNYIKLWGL